MDIISYELVANTIVVILAFCGVIVMVSNTVKAMKELHKPREDQTRMVMEHDEKLMHDYDDITELKQEMRIILETLLPMLQHLIDGDDVDSLKRQKEFLETYLINLVER